MFPVPQVLCPPAPKGCELQKEEVRSHKSAPRQEEDQVERKAECWKE